MKMQRTLVLITPDGVKKGLTEADVMAGSNLKVIKSRRMTPPWDVARKNYAEQEGKACKYYDVIKRNKYFYRTVLGISSGDVIAMIVESEDAVMTMLKIIGYPDDPTTLRGKYANPDVMHEHLVRASDSIESAKHDIRLWFSDYLFD